MEPTRKRRRVKRLFRATATSYGLVLVYVTGKMWFGYGVPWVGVALPLLSGLAFHWLLRREVVKDR